MSSTRLVSFVLLTTLISACSDAATGTGSRPLTVSVTTKTEASAAARDVVVGADPSLLVITKAQLVVRKIELVSATAAASCPEVDDDSCAEIEIGPFLLDLPLDASVKTDLSANVPAGSYRGIEVKIEPISSGNSRSTAFLAAHPELAGLSVHVEGTYAGRAFVFNSAVDTGIEMGFASPATVGGSGGVSNLTIAIDVASWFRSGSVTLDPTVAANASRIASNVATSFRAFDDDDHDGFDDRRH